MKEKRISRVAPGWVEKEVFRFSALKSHIISGRRDVSAVSPVPVDLDFTGGSLFSGRVYNSELLELIPFLVKEGSGGPFYTMQSMLEKHSVREELLSSNGNQERVSEYLSNFLYREDFYWSVHSTYLESQPNYDVYGALLKAANDALLLHLTWYKEKHWSHSTVISQDRFQKPERRQKRRLQKLLRSLRSTGWDIPARFAYFSCRSDSDERRHRKECRKSMARNSVNALVYGASVAKLKETLFRDCDLSQTSVILLSNDKFKTAIGEGLRVKALHPSQYVSNMYGAYVTNSDEEAKRVFSTQIKFSGIAEYDIDNICESYYRLQRDYNAGRDAYHALTFKQAVYDAWSMRMPEPAVKAIWNNSVFDMSYWGLQETKMPVPASHIGAHFDHDDAALKLGVSNVSSRFDLENFGGVIDEKRALEAQMEEAASGHSAIA